MASLGPAPPAVQWDAEAEAPAAPSGGILELYRSVWRAFWPWAIRRRLTIVVEVGMILLWVVLRTRYDVESRPSILWTTLAAAVALISPTSGLVLLAGTAAFFEPTTLLHTLGIRPAPSVLGLRHVLVVVLGLSVAIRLVAGGWRRMPWSPPVLLAIAIGCLTALGVAVTATRFPADWTKVAGYNWLSSIGGAMIVLVVAVWVARDRTIRPLIAAIASASAAVALSVVDQLQPGSISQGPLAWIGFWKDFGSRLGGAVPSPNGMAALAVMPVCILAAWAVLGRPRRGALLATRIVAASAAAVLFLAMYLTYSRAAILSLFGLAVVIAWRVNRRLGQIVLVVGLGAGLALLPSYLALRGQATNVGVLEPGSLLVATDALRLQAWDSAVHMWLDQPVTGQGFLAYKQLADGYGDTVLSSPHNEWLRLFAEEGTIAGVAGLGFVATTMWWLMRRTGPVASGILAGAVGYVLMATFNNPLLFIQVSVIVFVGIGYGLARSVAPRISAPPADATGDAGAGHP